MTTRPYSEVLAEAKALAGVDDFAAAETARLKIFINRRARMAYAESEDWERFLVVGEERIVSEDGLLPKAQAGLQTIGTIKRIHATEPFKSDPAGEYVDFITHSGGIQITGYVAAESTSGQSMVVTSSLIALNPDITGTYEPIGESDANELGDTAIIYRSTSNHNYTLTPYVGVQDDASTYAWTAGDVTASGFWIAAASSDYTSPDLVSWATAGTAAGLPSITPVTTYSAFITYKAALPTTYGDGDGEESDFPEEWASYAAQGAYASFLQSDGASTERVIVEEAAAASLLEQQLAKISRQGGAHLQTRVLSHANMQRR